jgi:hypothetical protein
VNEAVDNQKFGPASEHASDVAKLVGELELKKHMVLADDSIPQEEKARIVAEIEMQKIAMIKQVLAERKTAQISGAVKMKFSPNMVEVGDEQVNGNNLTVEVPTSQGESLEFSVGEDEVEMNTRRVRVRARIALDFENGVLTVNGVEVKLPDELMDAIKASTGDLELRSEGNSTVYEGNVRKQYKLFAIIPINADVFVRADAEEGSVLEMSQPWWAFMAV